MLFFSNSLAILTIDIINLNFILEGFLNLCFQTLNARRMMLQYLSIYIYLDYIYYFLKPIEDLQE